MHYVREELFQLLGGWPAPCSWALRAQRELTPSTENRLAGMIVEHLQLPCSRRTRFAPDAFVPALRCRPEGRGPFPVVLYCHAHGNRPDIGKQELLDGRPALSQGPYAQALVQR